MNKDFARGMIVSMALKALPVRKKSPISYLYNGVRLPALPEWDREAYPYAWIGFTESYGGVYVFAAEAKALTTLSAVYVSKPEVNYSCESSADTWVAGGLLNLHAYKVIWANHDVIKEDGNLLLSASDPIPIYNEPVNYLYNGVKLPKLPEWDKTVYPYAVLMASTNLVSIVALSSPAHMVFVDDGEYHVGVDAGTTYLSSVTVSASGEFTTLRAFSEKTADDVAFFSNEPDWANYDILNTDGSVYLAASEPIPVYE